MTPWSLSAPVATPFRRAALAGALAALGVLVEPALAGDARPAGAAPAAPPAARPASWAPGAPPATQMPDHR